jgi:hypothetical protein
MKLEWNVSKASKDSQRASMKGALQAQQQHLVDDSLVFQELELRQTTG